MARRKVLLVGCIAAIWLGAVGGSAVADDPPYVFYPSKDFGNFCSIVFDPTEPYSYNFVSTGANVAVQLNAFCSMWYADFDRQAISDWVNRAGLSLADHRVTFSFVPRRGGNTLDSGAFYLASWQAGCDWVEGDGDTAPDSYTAPGGWYDWYENKYNWSEGTAAAGKWSPEMRWKWDGPDKAPDLDNMTGWVLPDGTVLIHRPEDWSYAEGHKGIEELWFGGYDRFNSAHVEPTEPASGDPWTRYDMQVDREVMNDLLGDVATTKCRGLRIWGGAEAADPTAHDTSGMSTRWMFTREASAVNDLYGTPEPTDIFDYRPYLDVRLIGDASLDGQVDIADLGALATYYGVTTGATWQQGDFSGDEAVDIADLGALATHYGDGVQGAGVPEPTAVVLLCAALAGVLRRRQRH